MIFAHLKNSWRNHRTTLFASILAMSLVLSLLSAILLTRQNLVTMADSWGRDSELTVYLDDEVSEDKVTELRSAIAQIGAVESAVFVSKAESAQRFLKKMGHLAPNFLEQGKGADNPLPPTLDVHLKAGVELSSRLAQLEEVATKLSELSGVQDVSFGQGWMTQWSAFLRKFDWITLGFTLAVLLIGLLVIGNAVRVSLQARKEEIEILELVGATSLWIRAPFLVEGVLIGLVSAVLSLFLSNFFNALILSYVSDAGWLWLNSAQLRLSPLSAAFVIAVGMLFGGLGAYLCVRRVNSGWSAGAALE